MTQERPAMGDARARVDAVLDALRRVNLQVMVVGQPDLVRLEARDRARELAAVAGRGRLLESAAAAGREAAIGGFARSGFTGTWAATEMSASVTRAEDRIAAAAAFEEAAMAAVVEDLADEETLDVLRSAADQLGLSNRIPAPGALDVIGRVPAVSSAGRQASIVLGIGLVLAMIAGVYGGLPMGILVFALAAAGARWLARRASGGS
jgi:hypothetical protein